MRRVSWIGRPPRQRRKDCCIQYGYKNVIARPTRRSASTDAQTENQRVIFSGIQPTGIPHLGNYFGALRSWVNIQNEAAQGTKLLYSAVDLHSLTALQSPDFRRQSKRQTLATLLAVGLDPAKSIIFYQSDVPAHAELHWILSCDASMSALSRMTQWKSKVSESEALAMLRSTENPGSKQRFKLGLFSYPVLQAADVLVHGTTHVPVGEDQVQHIEFASECAKQFNYHHGENKEILIPPKTIVSESKRIKSLKEPEKKMSKSDRADYSRILLTDAQHVVLSKVKSAVTDSLDGITYDPKARPGVSNLMEIMTNVHPDQPSLEELEGEVKNMLKSTFKLRLAEMITNYLIPIQERYDSFIGMGERGSKRLDEVAIMGAEKASQSANTTLRVVKEALGL